MKKYLAIPLLLLIAVGHFGYIFICGHHQKKIVKEIKARIRAGMPDESLAVFEKNRIAPYITWKKKGKEFILNGEMYDVVRVKKNNGKTFIYCIKDSEEKKLLNEYADTFHDDNAGNANNKKQGYVFKLKFPESEWYTFTGDPVFFPPDNQYFPDADDALVTLYNPVYTPPPQT